MNNIFIISGPSGAGEDTIINRLEKELGVVHIITTTTRAMRPGDREGKPYYFISDKEFQDKIKNNEFVEYAKEYDDNYYGVTREELERAEKSGKIALWKIEYKGVMTAKKLFPEMIAIFINAESLEILEKRIRRRAEVTDQYVKERLDYTKEWLKHLDIYDYKIINEEGKLDETVEKVKEIILKNR
jgi:guanylate kinase